MTKRLTDTELVVLRGIHEMFLIDKQSISANNLFANAIELLPLLLDEIEERRYEEYTEAKHED